jgi:outer membrane scaffolding protein for murein synthesis (MipA/OmpV family)
VFIKTNLVSGLLLITNIALAAPVPVDTSALDRSVTDENRFGLGGTTSIAQRPFIGVDDQSTSLPYIKYRYQDFYIEGINIGYNLQKSERSSIELLATPRFYEVKQSFADNGELNGIEETKPTYLAGASGQYSLGPVTLTMQLLADVIESDGYEFILSASKTFKPSADVTLAPSMGVTYQDSELVDHFYGVQANEIAVGRPLYEADASLNPHLSVTAIWQASKHIQLLGQVKYEKLGDGITDSPIVDEDSIFTSVIGAVYLF